MKYFSFSNVFLLGSLLYRRAAGAHHDHAAVTKSRDSVLSLRDLLQMPTPTRYCTLQIAMDAGTLI